MNQFHAPAALLPGKEHPLYPSNRRLGGPQCGSGSFEEEINSVPLSAVESLIVQFMA